MCQKVICEHRLLSKILEQRTRIKVSKFSLGLLVFDLPWGTWMQWLRTFKTRDNAYFVKKQKCCSGIFRASRAVVLLRVTERFRQRLGKGGMASNEEINYCKCLQQHTNCIWSIHQDVFETIKVKVHYPRISAGSSYFCIKFSTLLFKLGVLSV